MGLVYHHRFAQGSSVVLRRLLYSSSISSLNAPTNAKQRKDHCGKAFAFLNRAFACFASKHHSFSFFASSAVELPKVDTVVLEGGGSRNIAERVKERLHCSSNKQELRKDDQHMAERSASETLCVDRRVAMDLGGNGKLRATMGLGSSDDERVAMKLAINNDGGAATDLGSNGDTRAVVELGSNGDDISNQEESEDEDVGNLFTLEEEVQAKEDALSQEYEASGTARNNQRQLMSQNLQASGDKRKAVGIFGQQKWAPHDLGAKAGIDAGILDQTTKAFPADKENIGIQEEPANEKPHYFQSQETHGDTSKQWLKNDFSWLKTLTDGRSRSRDHVLAQESEANTRTGILEELEQASHKSGTMNLTSILERMDKYYQAGKKDSGSSGILEQIEKYYGVCAETRAVQEIPANQEFPRPLARVHASPKMGVENNSTWKEALRFILPDQPKQLKMDQLKEPDVTKQLEKGQLKVPDSQQQEGLSPPPKHMSAFAHSQQTQNTTVDNANPITHVDAKTNADIEDSWWRMSSKKDHGFPNTAQVASVMVPPIFRSLTIKNCSGHISPLSMERFFRRCGEVASCYLVAMKDGQHTLHIEFKSEEGKNNALLMRSFSLDGHLFVVRKDVPSGSLVVRLKNVHPNTEECRVKRVCNECGEVKSIQKDGNMVDVHFKSQGLTECLETLDRLSMTTVDGQKWEPTVILGGFDQVLNPNQDICVLCSQMKQENQKFLRVARQLLTMAEEMSTKVQTR